MEKNPEEVVVNNTETNNSSIENANTSQSEAEQEASTSSAVFNRSKKNVKRRSYRQKNPHSDENDSSSSNIDESNKPGSSNTNLNDSGEQLKRKSLQMPEPNEKSPQTTKRKKRNPATGNIEFSTIVKLSFFHQIFVALTILSSLDGSDPSSVVYSNHESE